MAPLQDEAFDQELCPTRLDVSYIGAPLMITEGSNSRELLKTSDHCILNNSPKRSATEDISISECNNSKKQKYSSMSAEVCPTRDRAVIQKKLAKKFDIRYVKEMKNIKQRIQSSCLLSSCDQEKCPMMQERLTQHKRTHHSPYKTDYGCGTHKAMRDQGITVSPTLSRLRVPKFTLPLKTEEERCIQTDITMRDFSPSRLVPRTPIQKIFSDHHDTINNEIPLKKTETREILTKKNFYKEYLQHEVIHWLHHVPMFFSLNITNEHIQNEVVHNLVNKINALAVEINDSNYEIKTKMEIESCLNKLPMWLHGPKEDQILFKCSLREKLWNKVLELNKTFFQISYEKLEGMDPKLHESYEKEIIEWSQVLQLDNDESVDRRVVVELLMKKLSPLLKIPLHTTSYKLIIKGEIIEVLDNLSLTFINSRYRTVQLNKLAEELANRLLSLQIKQGTASPRHGRVDTAVLRQVTSQVTGLPVPQNNYRKIIFKKIADYLDRVPVCNRNDLKTEICSSFFDSNSCLRTGSQKAMKEEICQFLRDTGKVPWDKARTIAYVIVKQVNDVLRDARQSDSTSFDYVVPHLSRTVSVYRWGSEDPPTTSTPKKPKTKAVPKLNPEETTYLEKVAGLVKIWMRTLPKQYNEEPGFQKTVIYDLAGDIMDHQKLQQLAPDSTADKEKYQKYLIFKWLCKFDFFEEEKLRSESAPLVADFLRRLKDIEVPNLTAPQHGTRQEMEHIKHMERGGGWEEDYVARGIDVLEDQISVWLNEQPIEILSNKNKVKRNKMVHELALNLQDHLRNKDGESEIEEDINQWLTKMVNSKEKENIGLLTQDLKDKVINLPQDQTLGARHEERHRNILAKIAAKRKLKAGELPTQHEGDVSNFGNIQGDPDKTIREFIGKYIEHYYDINDPMATGAFAQLLKTELRKLAPPTRKEVYENFEQLKTHQRFNPESLKMELEYIKIISDWLNSIPIDPSYNTVHNRRRIEYVNDLARNIQEIEEQRLDDPNVMDYNFLIASTILTSMTTYDLPILPEHRENTVKMAYRLLEKVDDLRPPYEYALQTSTADSSAFSSSINMGDIREQNLSDFINDYIRVNGREIAEDELKLEAWTARLMKEVKKMIHDGADPNKLTKAQVYEKFSDVPIPTQASVEAFGLKIHYVKEITDWMKNLPLLPIEQADGGEERIGMISELAEKMCDTQAMRRAHPSDNSADEELEDYIANWIARLPLDTSKEIILPILIQQLMNRMEKGSKSSSRASLGKHRETSVDNLKSLSSSSNTCNNCSEKKCTANKSFDKGDKKKQRTSKDSSKSSSKRGSKDKVKTPADIIVEAIENWSNKLPIKLDNKYTEKYMKEGIARQLYQKIGELNVDPRIFNDELLYREMLEDEIETQLENVPQNSELQDKREQIKEELIDKIIGTNKIIKENSTGDNYRHKLETTIDASIPNPVQSMQGFDPGFEIYKNHLADMFILENFDHANDDVKAKYETRVRHEIDKYFECAQSKNALPLTKDQIYYEIYSALFKIPMPNENSVIDEVEQIKTRCEIDAWYEKLPIQQTDNINELLERDQILSTLAKRIQEIEKTGSKVDENIKKEARKWLEKLPFESGHGIDEHVKQLQSILKSTASARKYVAPEKETKGKSKKEKDSKDKKGPREPNTSQVPGPSGILQSKATNAKPCLQVCPTTHKKAGDILVEIVEEWCNNLPLISTEENNKVIRDNMSTRIIIQISEFNMDEDIFNDDVVYDELLDEELENILSNIPVCCDFAKSKPARKQQLKELIKSIKPLINEEKARHQYKLDLNNTVASVLKEPHETSAEKLAIFNQLKEEIVENFVQYYYYINDEESRQFYRNQIHDCVVKFCIEVRDKGTGEKVDPLVKRNQLLCELLKVPVPQSALREEVAEIKMKKEVETFLQELSIPEGDAKATLTKHLAKRLCDIEKSGYTKSNEKKMNSDITRCLTKLKKNVTPETVDGFVKKLKFNEAERKAPPVTSSQVANLNQSRALSSSKPFRTFDAGSAQDQPPGMRGQSTCKTPPCCKSAADENRVLMRDTSNAMPASNYYTPVSMHPNAPQISAWSPNDAQPYRIVTDSPIEYEDFRAGKMLNSTAGPQSLVPRGPSPDHRKTFSGRRLMNPNASLGNAQPSRHMSHQALSGSYPQYSRMREAMSGPVLSRQSVGPIVTPHRVGQSPRAALTQGSPASPRNITSDSLFEAPHFEPVPFPLTAVPVPIFDPFQLSGAGGTRQVARRSRPDNALPCLPIQGAGQAVIRERRLSPDKSDSEICICKRCARRPRRGPPYCLMAMDDDFDDCLGFPGMWYRMHLPDCFF